MRQLLAALGDNIKPKGKDWIARCPVHKDADFAMSITEGHDGSVLAHCFACGANGLDLYKELHLDLDELMGSKKLDSGYVPQKARDEYIQDKLVVAMSDSADSLADKRRVRLAEARITGFEAKYS